jgi:hypothetical protein
MPTLTQEQHNILTELVKRKSPNSQGWYSLRYDRHQEVHIWTCHLCHEIIHWARRLMNSGSILCDHGIKHLKDSNLLIFV